MSTASTVASVVLAAMLAFSAALDFRRVPAIVEAMARTGMPDRLLPVLGAIKAAGAAGLLVGLVVPAIGIAAAAGTVIYFVLAVAVQLRAQEPDLAPALTFGAVAVIALALTTATQALPVTG